MDDALFPYGMKPVVDGRLETLGAVLTVVRYPGAVSPRTRAVRTRTHWLELALTPRPQKLSVCFPERWDRHRYERAGDLLFLPAGELIQLRAETGVRHAAIVCEIDPSAFRHWTSGSTEDVVRKFEVVLDIASSTIRHLLRRLAEEARTPGIASARLTEALFVQLAIELARYCEAASDAPQSSGLAGWRLRLIDERIADFAHPPDLAELAALCGMSVRQLTRAFRASRGCSLGEYQVQLRLEAAKRRLAGSESIKEIAYSLGFASPSRFAETFRKHFAITPLQFRQRVLR